jgi:hypothetical protein
MFVSVAMLLAFVLPASDAGSARAQQGGIKVHGHWVIDVRNPDGTLVTHREFDNALSPEGPSVLTLVVGGASTPGRFFVLLGDANDGPCTSPAGSRACHIGPPNWSTWINDSNHFGTLTQSVEGGTVVLTGTATAAQAGSVAQVGTLLVLCEGITPPSDCVGGPGSHIYRTVTSATLPTPVAIAARQIIQVKVTLSFS